MPGCKLCGEPITAGIVLHSDCVKEAVEEVCTYRCKWAVICDDKQKLRERHCPKCGVTKLTELANGGEGCG